MLNIDSEHKINLDGFIEQDSTWQCPSCSKELKISNVIGFGSYPLGGWHNIMKPNNHYGVGFECPKCFTKSCFHGNEYVYELFIDVKDYINK